MEALRLGPGPSPSRRRPRRRRRRRGPSSLPVGATVSSAALSGLRARPRGSGSEARSDQPEAGRIEPGRARACGTFAARDIARLARAVVGACYPLSRRLGLQSLAAGTVRARGGGSRGRFGLGGPGTARLRLGERFGRVRPRAGTFGSRLARAFGDDSRARRRASGSRPGPRGASGARDGPRRSARAGARPRRLRCSGSKGLPAPTRDRHGLGRLRPRFRLGSRGAGCSGGELDLG